MRRCRPMPNRLARLRRPWAPWRGTRCWLRMPSVAMRRCVSPRPSTPANCAGATCMATCCIDPASSTASPSGSARTSLGGRGRVRRHRRPVLGARPRRTRSRQPGLGLRAAAARERLVRALAADPPPGTAVVRLDRYGEIEHSSLDAERWLAEHFGPAEHPAWLPDPVAEWLALPPRPPLASARDGRRLTVRLLHGDPHALLLEEEVAQFRTDALDRLGLTPRETEVLRAASAMEDEAAIAWELFLSLHAVRERLSRL